MQQQRRHQRRLPVMHMNHVRLPRQIPCEMRDALGKENVALCIVGITDVVLEINAGAVKKARMMDEINQQTFLQLQRPEFRLNPLVAKRQIELPVHALDFWKFFPDAPIQRRDDARFLAVARQRLAKRGDHVGQAAGFGEGMNFAAGEQNSHICDLRFTIYTPRANCRVNRKSNIVNKCGHAEMRSVLR